MQNYHSSISLFMVSHYLRKRISFSLNTVLVYFAPCWLLWQHCHPYL